MKVALILASLCLGACGTDYSFSDYDKATIQNVGKTGAPNPAPAPTVTTTPPHNDAPPEGNPPVVVGNEHPYHSEDDSCNRGCDANSKDKKIKICHIPPGNVKAAHTLCISKSAIHAHIDEHRASNGTTDYYGECL